MPVRNAGRHLHEAVASIRLQSYTNWELLVMDDGSDDGEVDGLARLDDARIRIFRDSQNLGVATRLNQAVDHARGVFLARMDADDVAFPERFRQQLALLLTDDAPDLVGAAAITIDEEDAVVGMLPAPSTHAEICARPWQGFHMAHPGWMGRTAWFRDNRYAMPAPYACEDQELLLRTYASSRFSATTEVLLAYRLRSKVDWSKLARTRRAWLQVQWAQFVAAGQWSHLALALGCYALRSARDAWYRMRARSFHPAVGVRVADPTAQAWAGLSQTLRAR